MGKGDGSDIAGVPAKMLKPLTAFHIPQPDRFIPTSGKKVPAVGREGHALHHIGVPVVGTNFLSKLGIPQPNCIVLASRKEPAAVRRNRHTLHRIMMPGKSPE